MARFRNVMVVVLVGLTSVRTMAQDQGFSKDWITPERLGLPKGNNRTSEPFVTRIYKTDANGDILKKQPAGYPFTITSDYTLKEGETARVHEGVDLSSRPQAGQRPTPLDFKAGVYGVVVRAGGGAWGTIKVQIRDGSLIQYLHTSASHVKVGDIVAPDTKLGVTGRTGAAVIHLHIQAKDKHGNTISPDLAFRAGQRRLESKTKLERPDPDQLDFDPDAYSPVKPKIVSRAVSSKVEPEKKPSAAKRSLSSPCFSRKPRTMASRSRNGPGSPP